MASLVELTQKLKISANIPPPATNVRSINDGLANIYTFNLKPGAVVFRYDVELTDLAKDKSLTMGAADDGKKGLLKDICYDLVSSFIRKNNNGVLFVYDNRKNLFTNKHMDSKLVEIPPAEMTERSRQFLRNATVRLEIVPCVERSHQLRVDDLESSLQPAPHEQADHSLRTFLEMLTSQHFINAGTHRLVGPGRLFEVQQHRQLHDAIVSHRGIAKGVRIIANGGEKPCAALVIEVKTCAFFAPGNLEQIALKMMDKRRPSNQVQQEAFWAEFGQLFKGVSAFLTYAPSRVIVIDSITQRRCKDVSFEIDGQNMAMVDYFRNKKNTEINPNLPAVRQHQDRDALYPLNCLQILPFQRLPMSKNSNEEMARISSELLKANASFPHIRYAAIVEEITKIGNPNGPCAQFMMNFGARLTKHNEVKIGMHALPPVLFGNRQTQNQDERGRFDIRGPHKFLEPSVGVVKRWMVAHSRRVAQQQIGIFIDQILRIASQRGMNLPEPEWDVMELQGMKPQMEKFKRDGFQFLLYVDNKFVKSHGMLKLLERELGLLTQHITLEMIGRSKGPMSPGNVVAKMNMKLMGLNYLPIFDNITKAKLDMSTGDLLVIGIDTSKPPRATGHERFMMKKQGMEGFESEDPMVVGICANYLKDPRKFAGDYFFQPCTQDVVDPEYLADKMRWIFRQIKQNRGKQPPKTIFIIRDGISEGMVPNAVQNEFAVMRKFCDAFAPGWKPNFVYCIVDKRHHKRFFLKGNGDRPEDKALNTMPGSAIDRKVVRVDMHEFFLQAHFPLKGTSKIPQYVIPVNDINANNEELQAFLLTLCNMWQIVNLAPALPTPVLQAKELAKRGRNNFVELKHVSSNQRDGPGIPHDATHPQRIDFRKLNEQLAYAYQPQDQFSIQMSSTRFNA